MITTEHQDFSDYCPHCEENRIKEQLYQTTQEDDFEDNLEYLCANLPLCKGCRADEESDNRRA